MSLPHNRILLFGGLITIIKFNQISNFGVFDSYNWKNSINSGTKKEIKFKKLNLLYGRNYSGKTTLSRLLRSFETGVSPEKYPNLSFELETDQGKLITQNNIANSNLNIRVYNKDFIRKNLKFLQNEEENIEAFAIFGEHNVDIENNIAEKRKVLGSIDEKYGLKYEFSNIESKFNSKNKELNDSQKSLDEKLRRKANDEIKTNPLYSAVNYNIQSIKKDIEFLTNNPRKSLEESEVNEKKTILDENPKDNIEKLGELSSCFDELYSNTVSLLSKEVVPAKPLQDLLNDTVLQEWVRQGIEHHKGKRECCAFCGNPISKELWDKLGAHFNKESDELRDSIKFLIEEIKKEKIKDDFFSIENIDLYSVFSKKFEGEKRDLNALFKQYNENLDSLISELNERKKDIFNTREILEITDNSAWINEAIRSINKIIEGNNTKTKSLSEDQENAREDLRLDEVFSFIKDIDYEGELEKRTELNKEFRAIKENKEKLEQQISKINDEISDLINQQNDEKKGADKVNEYLNHFFGHDSLRFKPIENDNGKVYGFQIFRGDEIAYNLSDGECSLVGFCYFMAKLQDLDTKGKDLIIWIDDPISSLDSSHVFFIYSLIENELTQPVRKENTPLSYNYEQMFISTHNLDFLKYLKRLKRPQRIVSGNPTKKENDCEFFIVERIDKSSKLKLMPKYLKKYVTEFNYLFDQVYKCANVENADEDHECFYNFGNNMRKFLEAYLFYRYPTQTIPPKDKLQMFFGNDEYSVHLTTRLDNEYSHLEEIFDRSMKPVEVPEIPKLANYVLSKIEQKDKDQYDALIKSISNAS